MSPTEREAVINKMLTGEELKTLIRQSLDKLLAADGMLTSYVAYGRVAYDIRLRLHVDSAMTRLSESSIASSPIAHNIVDKSPTLAAVESAPLRSPSADAVISATEATHTITSPNAERLNAGLPLTLDTREQDGSKIQKSVAYPIPEPGEVAQDLKIADVTPAARADWDQQEP